MLLLQDVHWSAGLFSYFPTYSLGAMYAAQLYEHAAASIPGLEEQLAAGEFKPLKVRQGACWLYVDRPLLPCVLPMHAVCACTPLSAAAASCMPSRAR